MKRHLKKILLRFPGFQLFCRLLTRRHVRVLMYHRFSADETANPRFTSAAALRSQLRYIGENHPIWTPDDQLDALEGKRPWEACPVVLTVDDGYRDFFEIAFPVLRAARAPATLFVTTGFVDGKGLLWWDRLTQLLEGAQSKRLALRLGDIDHLFDLTAADGRWRAWNRIADHCRFLPDLEKERFLLELAGRVEAGPERVEDPRFAAVSWEEVRLMAGHGVNYGAHTVTHPILSRQSRERARWEIERSGRRLREETGAPCTWFCYPQGGPADFTPEIEDLVNRAGFRGSYLAYQDPGRGGHFALSRYCVPQVFDDLRWCLCGAEYLGLRLRALIGRPVRRGAAYWAGSRPAPGQEKAIADTGQEAGGRQAWRAPVTPKEAGYDG